MSDPRLALNTFLPYRLSVASNAASEAIARIYRSLFGLSIPEWRMVAVVAESDGITQQALGARTRMDKVTVSRAAIALAARGLLDRRSNPGDGRSHLLHLTAAGRTLYDAVAPKALALEQKLLCGFAADEIAAFHAMLRRIEDAASTLDDAAATSSPRG